MVKKEKQKHSSFLKFISKLLILVIVVLVCLILLKSNADLRNKIYKKVFENNINFTKINEFYQKKFGSSLPFKDSKQEEAELVSNIKLEYNKKEKYKDGVKLVVSDSYLVPSMDSGLVIFKGEKENYGSTIIVQRADDIEVWYCNLKNINVSLYDYIKKGDYLGEAAGTNIYLAFQKEGKFLDYQKFI